MGYYSDVGICMYKEDFVNMLNTAKEENEYAFAILRNARYQNNFNHKRKVIIATIEWIKWYTEGSGWIDNYLLHRLPEDVPYVFSKVGESSAELDGENVYSDNDDDLYIFCEAQAAIVTNGDDIYLGDFYDEP